jgi:hypothetical protein
VRVGSLELQSLVRAPAPQLGALGVAAQIEHDRVAPSLPTARRVPVAQVVVEVEHRVLRAVVGARRVGEETQAQSPHDRVLGAKPGVEGPGITAQHVRHEARGIRAAGAVLAHRLARVRRSGRER